jgi:hypothetical protein
LITATFFRKDRIVAYGSYRNRFLASVARTVREDETDEEKALEVGEWAGSANARISCARRREMKPGSMAVPPVTSSVEASLARRSRGT